MESTTTTTTNNNTSQQQQQQQPAEGTTTSTAVIMDSSTVADTDTPISTVQSTVGTMNAAAATAANHFTFDSSLSMKEHENRVNEIFKTQDDRTKYEHLKKYRVGLKSVEGEESKSLQGKVSNELLTVGDILIEQCSNDFSALNCTDDTLAEIIKDERVEDLNSYIMQLEAFTKKWEDYRHLNEHQVETNELLTKYKGELEKLKKHSNKGMDRVASISFAIDQEFIGSRDLQEFQARVDNLFKWHVNDYETYMAPYFPIIQSSGMGKTKIMREYQIQEKKSGKGEKEQTPGKGEKEQTPGKGGRSVIFVLCKLHESSNDEEQKIYNRTLLIKRGDHNDQNSYNNSLMQDLDEWAFSARESNENKQVVFLFDEAQFLLTQNGVPFRKIRWWLRSKNNTPANPTVAVFAGTNSDLANFYNEPPNTRNSRDPNITYYEGGNKLYKPFFEICTIGLLRQSDHVTNASDYEKAICYGRPLFTLLHRQDLLESAIPSILKRMLLSQDEYTWETNQPALLSILATRVQMGQTSASVVSKLVSQGYANLTYFSSSEQHDQLARYCYFPDPVCARMAMCLMDKDWRSDTGNYQGKKPRFWTEKAFEMFANGMCAPNKGDLGEIAAAFYLLFCGDMLRKAVDSKYTTFGISLQEWLKLLKNPRIDLSALEAGKVATDSEKVSFIQFSRLYLRLPWTDLLTQEFLKDLYMSGTACFVYPACPVFDIVVSIQNKTKKGTSYKALLISVKARKTFGMSEITNVYRKFNSIKKKIKVANLEDPLCMLLLVGAESEERGPWETTKGGKIALYVPHDDPFGVTDLVLNSTDEAECSETYSSHCHLPSFASRVEDASFGKRCLRAKTTIIGYLMKMLQHMALSKKRNLTNEGATDAALETRAPNTSIDQLEQSSKRRRRK